MRDLKMLAFSRGFDHGWCGLPSQQVHELHARDYVRGYWEGRRAGNHQGMGWLEFLRYLIGRMFGL